MARSKPAVSAVLVLGTLPVVRRVLKVRQGMPMQVKER